MTEIYIPVLSRHQYEELASALRKLVWSYIFIYFEFNLANVDVFPDWAGYFLIYLALETLQKYSPPSGLLRNFAAVLTCWTLFQWTLKLFFGEVAIPLIPLVFSIMEIYFHFQLLTNLADLSDSTGCSHGDRLRTLRTFATLLQTVLALPVPWKEIGEMQFIAAILLLISFGILAETVIILNLMKKELAAEAEHL